VVTILVDQAVAKDEIVEADARRELEETVAALAHPGDDAEFIQLLDRRAWCQARLKLLASTS
jgi:F0F1-type ATP synthase epsilon subunit